LLIDIFDTYLVFCIEVILKSGDCLFDLQKFDLGID